MHALSLTGSSSHPAPPGWEGGVILKASTSLKFHPHITCLHTVVVVVWVHMKGLEYVRNVYVGHNHSRPGFSNDRVGFSKLAPVITHDPSVLWFPHCTADSLVFLSWFSFLFLNKYCAWCPSWDRNELQTLPLLFYFPSSRTCPLFLLFLKSLVSFSQPAHPSSQALLKPFSKQISCKWSSFDFFFSLLVARSFQGNQFLLWSGFCQGLIGLLGTGSTKARGLPLNGGGRLSGCGGGNQLKLRITPSFTCVSVLESQGKKFI